jgi:hypothetical protein
MREVMDGLCTREDVLQWSSVCMNSRRGRDTGGRLQCTGRDACEDRGPQGGRISISHRLINGLMWDPPFRLDVGRASSGRRLVD